MNDELFHCPRRGLLGAHMVDFWQSGATRWDESVPWPFGCIKPRVCSYCGGVNPDDAIALVVDGWSFGRTNRRYRLRMHAPGPISPLPEVKLYLVHCTREQVTRADEVMRGHRAFMFESPAQAVQ